MLNPVVSIGIPAYKSTYLREAILSALNQTFRDIEVIVVNDHSPYDLDTIIDEFKDDRLSYYVNEKNLGRDNIVKNWNRCLSLSKGEFFCLLCDDDVYAPEFIEEMLSLSEKYPNCNVFRSRVKMIDNEGRTTDYYPSSPEYETMVDYMFHKEKNLRQQTVSEFMLNRAYIIEHGGYIEMPVGWESDVASIYAFSKDNGIATSAKTLVSFRQSGINISTAGTHMVDKIAAMNRFSVYIFKLLEDSKCDDEYADIIRKWREITLNKNKFEYLRASSWKDVVYLWRNRKTDDVSITTKDFYVAILYRFGFTIMQIFKSILH